MALADPPPPPPSGVQNAACSDCGACQSTAHLITYFIVYTYEFANISSLVSPLAIIVALWCMTSPRMRELMSGRGRGRGGGMLEECSDGVRLQ